jgi:hypothetical protein
LRHLWEEAMNYVRLAIIVAIGMLLAGAGAAVLGYRHVAHVAQAAAEAARSELAQYQASATAVIQERISAEQRTAQLNTQREKANLSDYQTRIATLRSKYDRVLAAAGSTDKRSVPAPSGTATPSAGADAGTPEQRFIGELQACETERERLRALQRWIRETQ